MDDRTLLRIRKVAELVAKADGLLITAGAGMGVDSGLPDFRGAKGFWAAYPPLEKLGISFEEMAQPHWFDDQPEMAWAWYGHRQQLYRETEPHAGYRMLREWALAMPVGSFVVTSNVDGHFYKAGFAANRILEQHGNIHRYQCTAPCTNATWAAAADLQIELTTLTVRGALPLCPTCGALARPNVLMFNDTAWVRGNTQEQIRRFERWLAGTRGRRVVILEFGAGTAIATIRRVGERVAERSLTTLVRINPAASADDDSIVSLRVGALEALRMIERVLPEHFRQRCNEAAVLKRESRDDRIEDHRGEVTKAGSTERLERVPAGEMEVIEFFSCSNVDRSEPAWSTGAANLCDLRSIAHVDLDFGQVEPFNYLGISTDDEQAVLARWYGPAPDQYAPLPDVGGHTSPGYLMTGRVIRSPESVAGGGPGAAVMLICGPDREAIMTVAVARRPLDGAYLWRQLYENAPHVPKPLDYPRTPWVARRLDAAATKHAAMLPVLADVARVMAWTWLRLQAYYDQQGRTGKDD
jgi:NAD-dependent SIR2 family protein deacetylase